MLQKGRVVRLRSLRRATARQTSPEGAWLGGPAKPRDRNNAIFASTGDVRVTDTRSILYRCYQRGSELEATKVSRRIRRSSNGASFSRYPSGLGQRRVRRAAPRRWSTDRRQGRTRPGRSTRSRTQWTMGEILAHVADAWPRRQQVEGRVQRVTNANGSVLVVGSNEPLRRRAPRQTESAETRP
jgi:hypothetical protein